MLHFCTIFSLDMKALPVTISWLWSSSCSRYSLSSEYTRSSASFHCTCSDLPFLRRLDREAETSAKAGMWSLSHLLLGGRLLKISLEFSSVLQMAFVKTHIFHLESQTLFCTNLLDQPVSASICQYPLVKSILDRYFLPLGRRNRPSAVIMGSGSTSVILFNFLTHNMLEPLSS